jgi:hypothetical protein
MAASPAHCASPFHYRPLVRPTVPRHDIAVAVSDLCRLASPPAHDTRHNPAGIRRGLRTDGRLHPKYHTADHCTEVKRRLATAIPYGSDDLPTGEGTSLLGVLHTSPSSLAPIGAARQPTVGLPVLTSPATRSLFFFSIVHGFGTPKRASKPIPVPLPPAKHPAPQSPASTHTLTHTHAPSLDISHLTCTFIPSLRLLLVRSIEHPTLPS